MTRPPLTVHNAEVRTATVEIKTLTVTGKQVTLAVFRQLINKSVLDDDSQVRGDMWGTVNYHPDKCADNPEHLHVAWQQGTDLRRAVLYTPSRALVRTPVATMVIEAAIRDGLRPGSANKLPNAIGLSNVWTHIGGADGKGVTFDFGGVRFSTRVSKEAVWAYEGLSNYHADPEIAAWREDVEDLPPLGDLLPELHADRYWAAWNQVKALPQLFIAV